MCALGVGGIIAISIVTDQLIRGSSNTSWYTPFVLVLCYSLALAMPINAALSTRTIRHRAMHIANGVVGILLFAAFVGFLYRTVHVPGTWGYCLLAAVLFQVFMLLNVLSRLVADWIALVDLKRILGIDEAGLALRSSDSATTEPAVEPNDQLRGLDVGHPDDRLSVDGEPRAGSPRQIVSTAWFALVVGMSLNLIVQFACVFLLAGMVRPNKTTLQDYETQIYELLTAPSFFLAIVVLSQASVLAVVMFAARLSPLPTLQRLALLPVHWNPSRWAMVIASCLFPVGVGVILVEILGQVIAPDPTLETVLRNLSPAQWWLYLVVIALLPGFIEELLFRGYFQSRLHLRWHPAVCVTLSGVLFGLFHIHPHAIVFATVVGMWFAYIAYCSGSTWPTIACHVAINALMTLLSWMAIYTFIDSGIGIGIILALSGLVPFVRSLRWLSDISKPLVHDGRGQASGPASLPCSSH